MGLTWRSSVVSPAQVPAAPENTAILASGFRSPFGRVTSPHLLWLGSSFQAEVCPGLGCNLGKLGLRRTLWCCHLFLPFQISSLSYWGMSRGHQCHGGDRRRSHWRRAWGTRVIIVATLGNIIYQRNQSPSYYPFFSSKVCRAVLIDLMPLTESWGPWTYQV